MDVIYLKGKLDDTIFWSPWCAGFNDQPSGEFTDVTAIKNRHNSNVELYALDKDGRMYHCWFDGRWHAWRKNFNEAPNFSQIYGVRNKRKTELFGVSDNLVLYHCSFENTWSPWHK